MSKIFAIAFNTWREAIRDRILLLILVFGVLIISAGSILSLLSLGQGERVLFDLGMSGIAVFGLLVTLFIATSVVGKEMDKRTIYLVLTKPVERLHFILGKHLGMSLILTHVLGLMGVVFGVLFWLWTHHLPPALPLGVVGILVELWLLSAVAIVFSTFASPVMSAVYTLATYLIGHLSHDLLVLGEKMPYAGLSYVTKTLYYVLPDLERLNFKNVPFDLPIASSYTAQCAGYGLLYMWVVLFVAVAAFELKEV
ncbi:MAG: ABC transporter permease [Candidatus Sericytochromatia bacterium]|nr:ABC transporter permease [Candidatus Sericytochromatia bacterium]